MKNIVKKAVIILIILMTMISVKGTAQSQIFYRYSLPYTNDMLDSCLKLYVQTVLNNLERNNSLDLFAKSRVDYYLDVIQTNLEEGKDLFSIFDYIPGDYRAHQELFGNPMYFTKPKTNYPDKYQINVTEGLEGNGEIMQELVFYWQEYNRIQSGKDIVLKVIKKNESKGKMFLHLSLFYDYKNSPPHNRSILRKGDGKFGTSTRILISEKKVGNLWVYEAMIYNVVVFSKPIKKET
ncbi:MAG: hypothetical protein NTZ33_04815 [Bacteroidetes bacterium]|nr:hypothetical protein [Bacteroidota bacterium]